MLDLIKKLNQEDPMIVVRWQWYYHIKSFCVDSNMTSAFVWQPVCYCYLRLFNQRSPNIIVLYFLAFPLCILYILHLMIFWILFSVLFHSLLLNLSVATSFSTCVIYNFVLLFQINLYRSSTFNFFK